MKTRKLMMLCLVAFLVVCACISFNTDVAEAKNVPTKDVSSSVIAEGIELNIDGFMSKYLTGARVDEVAGINPDIEFDIIIELEDPAVASYRGEMNLRDFLISNEGVERTINLQNKQQTVMNAIEELDINVKFSYNFTGVINAIGARVRYGDITKIGRITGVKSVTLSETYAAPDVSTTDEDMIEVGLVNTESGYTGEGMLIGILDTGANLNHEVYQVIPENGKLTKEAVEALIPSLIAVNGYQLDYWKDGSTIYDQSYYSQLTIDDVYYNGKIPYAFNYGQGDTNGPGMGNLEVGDIVGHGNHVASTAAGNAGSEEGDFRGVAYDAQLAIMKVFTNSGASQLNIIAALQDCILLGCDSINLSLGSPSGFGIEYYNYEYYQAIEDAGIVMNISAGNSTTMAYSYGYGNFGNNPLIYNTDFGIVGSPSSYEQSFTVASIDAVKKISKTFKDEDGSNYLFNEIPDKNFYESLLGDTEGAVEYQMVYAGLGSVEEFSAVDVAGKVALVQRGSLNFSDKIKNAGDAGAIACIVFDNVDGSWINMSITLDSHIPGMFIYKADGEKLVQQIEAGKDTLSFSYDYVLDFGYLMSDFSSWGPLGDLTLKPEITAPGGQIYAAYNDASVAGNDTYDYLSGTSMSSPHMTGMMALLLEYIREVYPDLDATEQRLMAMRLMMSTADIIYNAEGDYIYTPRQQGAGLGKIYDAVNTNGYIYVEGEDKTKVELSDDPQQVGLYNFDIIIKNISEEAMTYNMSSIVMTQNIMSNGYQFDYSTLNLPNATTFEVNGTSVTAVEVPANQEVVVTVYIALSEQSVNFLKQFPCGNFVDGYILAENEDENQSLNVPFLAFFGDWTWAPYVDYSIYDDYASLNSTYDTFMVGTYSGIGGMQLGVYAFSTPEGVEEPAANINKIAIAPENEGKAISELAYSYIGILRNMRNAYYRVYDEDTKEVYYEVIYDSVRKTYFNTTNLIYYPDITDYNWNTANARPFYDYGLPSGTNLIFEFGGDPEFELEEGREVNSMNPTFTLPITIDNILPEFVEDGFDLSLNEEGRLILTFNVTDNHYAMTAWPMAVTINEKNQASLGDDLCDYMKPIDESQPGAVTTMQYDITDYMHMATNGYIAIGMYDYALNFDAVILGVGELPIMNGPTDVEVSTESSVYTTGSTFNLDVTLLPINYGHGLNINYLYEVEEGSEELVTVDENGLFTVVGFNGTAKVRVSVMWNDPITNEIKAVSGTTTFDIINPPSYIIVKDGENDIVENAMTVATNYVGQLNVSIPEGTYCEFESITYTSDNAAVVIDEEGIFKAYQVGVANLKVAATYLDNTGSEVVLEYTVAVTVTDEAVDELVPQVAHVYFGSSLLDGKAINGYYNDAGDVVSIMVGDTLQFNYVFEPWYASQEWQITPANALGGADYFTVNDDMSITCLKNTGGSYGMFYLESVLDPNEVYAVFGLVVIDAPADVPPTANKIAKLTNNMLVDVNSEGQPEEEPEFVIVNGVLTAYNGTSKDIVIPAEVHTINAYVFRGMALDSVTIHENVVFIGTHAFAFTGITTLNLPTVVDELVIESAAFFDVSLENLVIPYGTTEVGLGAFSKVTGEIFIPATLTVVDFGIFNMSNNATYVIAEDHPTLFVYEDAVIDIYGNYLLYMGDALVNRVLRIPDGITRIGSYAFNNKDLNTVIIPESVKRIAQHAFLNNGLFIVFEGMEAPVLEIEYFQQKFVNFSNQIVYYPVGATGYDHWTYGNQASEYRETTPDSILDIFSIGAYNNEMEKEDSMEIFFSTGCAATGADIYLGTSTEELELYTTIDKIDNQNTLNVEIHDLDYLVEYTVQVIAWMFDAEGNKIYSQPASITFVCEPYQAYYLDGLIESIMLDSIEDVINFYMFYNAVEELDEKDRALMQNLDRLQELLNIAIAIEMDYSIIIGANLENIATYREIYDSLTEEQKALVTEYHTILYFETLALLNNANASIELLNEEIAELKEEVKEYKEMISELSAANNDLKAEMDARVKEAEKRLAEAEKKIAEAEKKMEEAEEAYKQVMSCSTGAGTIGNGGSAGGLGIIALLAVGGLVLVSRKRKVQE